MMIYPCPLCYTLSATSWLLNLSSYGFAPCAWPIAELWPVQVSKPSSGVGLWFLLKLFCVLCVASIFFTLFGDRMGLRPFLIWFELSSFLTNSCLLKLICGSFDLDYYEPISSSDVSCTGATPLATICLAPSMGVVFWLKSSMPPSSLATLSLSSWLSAWSYIFFCYFIWIIWRSFCFWIYLIWFSYYFLYVWACSYWLGSVGKFWWWSFCPKVLWCPLIGWLPREYSPDASWALFNPPIYNYFAIAECQSRLFC